MTRTTRRTGSASAEDLEQLMKEVLAAFFALRAAGQQSGLVTDWGGGTWGLLRTIAADGPMTMSDLARKRSVSRQYIQKLAAGPLRDRLIELAPNEANQRAPLMTLTALGRKRLAAYGATIRRALGALSTHFDAEDVEQAAATVRRLRELLQPAARP